MIVDGKSYEEKEKGMNKKRLAWVLAVVLLLSLLPVGGMAAQKDNKLGYKLFRG